MIRACRALSGRIPRTARDTHDARLAVRRTGRRRGDGRRHASSVGRRCRSGPVRSGASRQPTIDLRSRADRKTRTTGNAEPACTALRRTAAGIASVVFARREARSRAPNKPLNID
ncbi:hypothetical protein DF147_20355 [Burkholderia cenocepacia]|nr:hypothetical protein DF147_20355 [Burkholderia cenocepacia]RQV90497.1 hypothetical protein DF019_08025 [Burkholderia cenocepacia]